MPVYNCRSYISEAIQSILNQTIKDFELIIIDDASTDGTQDVIKSFKDERIIFIQKQNNTGYTKSLNLGIEKVRGEFIARMDGDDISLPHRFERQLAYLSAHPDVILCSSSYEFLNQGRFLILPNDIDDLKISFLEICLITHPAVLVRKWVFDRYHIRYDASCEPAEDYNLWVDLLQYGKIGNIEEPLIKYRIHANQTSNVRAALQLQQAEKAQLKMLSYLVENITIDEKEMHFALIRCQVDDRFDLKEIKRWKEKLGYRNITIDFFHRTKFNSYLEAKFTRYKRSFILESSNYSLRSLIIFLNPSLKLYKGFTFKEIAKYIIKCSLGTAGTNIATTIRKAL